AARARSAAPPSGTRTTKTPGGTAAASKSESTIAPAPPARITSPRKRLPSKRSPRSARKQSPGPTSRLSTTSREAGRPVLTTRPPVARAMRNGLNQASGSAASATTSHLPGQRAPRVLGVVERHDRAADHLPRLVALAGDQHDLAGDGRTDRAADRGLAVGDPHPLGAMVAEAGLDVVEDRLGILAARVVARQIDAVGV